MTPKTLLITGATDGLGRGLALRLASHGHTLLLHGRDRTKLDDVVSATAAQPGAGSIRGVLGDLASGTSTKSLGTAVRDATDHLDVVVHNAGVFRARPTRTPQGVDIRMAVNAIAPLVLSDCLLSLLGNDSRMIAVSSAAQARVDLKALVTGQYADDMDAYAQSKLAVIHWARFFGRKHQHRGIAAVSVNPGSLLATKMVRDGFGIAGSDIEKGVSILERLALGDDFAATCGCYFDNDVGQFAKPYADAMDNDINASVVAALRNAALQAGYFDE